MPLDQTLNDREQLHVNTHHEERKDVVIDVSLQP